MNRPAEARHRVLLIEDNPGDAGLAVEWLDGAPASFSIRHVSSLAAAGAALAEPFDVILLDLHLPDSQGLATLREVKARAPATPVIVLSGDVDHALRLQAISDGAEDAVPKGDAHSPLFARSVLYVIARDHARARHTGVRALLDSTPDAILVVDDTGIVRYVNRAALGLFRRQRDDFVGELLGFSVQDGASLEITIPRRDGERIGEMRVVPFDWLGVPSWLAAIRDVTELKRSQQEAVDRQLLAEHHATALRRVLDDIAGLATRCGLNELARTTATLASVRAGSTTFEGAIALVLASFESAFRAYVDANALLERQNRELADAKTAAELSNRELEAFTSRVAHDLRAPLRRIESFSRILADDHAGDLDADGHRHLSRIVDCARRMSEVIESLLALSRIARAELRRAPVDLSRLARQVLDRMLDSGPSRSIELVIAPGLAADADRSLVQIVLENLLANALKFTSRQPSARIELGTIAGPGAPVYFVRDDGAGFDPAYADRLFGVFSRLHSVNEFDGTGIGLSIVKCVIERHGGRIWAESALGQGACFYFTLAR